MAAASKTLPEFDTLLNGSGPLGVAVSGGGDSLALLCALAEWNRRPLHIFTVDHGINPDSARWTDTVAGHAARLNLPFTALQWTGPKPQTGLSAAARRARHALLADAVRAERIRVVCLAHTADDIAETQAMRTQGSTVGIPRTWSPSPVWPQGRGVHLCRPLLERTRTELRQYLTARGLAWIDDPSNDSPHSLRARARRDLAGQPPHAITDPVRFSREQLAMLMPEPSDLAELGLLSFRAEAVAALPRDQSVKLLSAAAVCAGGGDRLPLRARVEAVLDAADDRPRTLAGARLFRRGGLIHVVREAGDIGRHGDPSEGDLWDGRFEVTATASVVAAKGLQSQLPDADRTWLRTLPPELRGVLPVINHPSGPLLAHAAHRTLRPDVYDMVTGWVGRRFLAAVRRVAAETDL